MTLRTRGTSICGLREACALLVLLAWLSRSAYAQVRDSGWATIRGTVYDSLLHSPLIGARVWVLNSSRATETDHHGRYRLDSVLAGPQVVTFSHPALDSIGLSSFASAVTVSAGDVNTVLLAVPSHATFWRAACGTFHDATSDSGLVFGAVTDVRTGARLMGARVTVSWVAVTRARRGRWVVDHPAREVTTDSLGLYYVCGVPVEYLFSAGAQAGPFASGLAEAVVDIRGIAKRDLSVSHEGEWDEVDPAAPGGRRGLATVMGTVRGERGGRLPGALATVDDAEPVAEADSAGVFVLRDLPAGTQMLMVRRVGDFAWRQAVELRNRDTLRVDVGMREATVLDTLRVVASPVLAAVIEEIDLRRQTAFGYFLGPAEIRQRPNTRSLFEGIPSLKVSGRPDNFHLAVATPRSILGAGENAMGGCPARVFIDGFPADEEQLSSMVSTQIFAVEVYPRPTVNIGRYAASFDDCGVVLVWTKYARPN